MDSVPKTTEPAEPVAGSVAALERDWAARVRGNRDQVERLREVADPADFYAPVTELFRDDPGRTDDPVLNRLLALAEPGETWLDIGAGAGRYALPLGRRVGEVVAIDPSPGMIGTLAREMSAWQIFNIEPIVARWPDDTAREAQRSIDGALMAHVGYDIEAIGPFVAAMERVTRRLCVAVLMERSPASISDPYWTAIHGEERVALPALPEFLALLLARERLFEVSLSERPPRRWASRADLVAFLRRQLWLHPDSAKARRLEALVETLPAEPDGAIVDRSSFQIGLVSWSPVRPTPA
jgi:SAM-dependent methyltransferase